MIRNLKPVTTTPSEALEIIKNASINIDAINSFIESVLDAILNRPKDVSITDLPNGVMKSLTIIIPKLQQEHAAHKFTKDEWDIIVDAFKAKGWSNITTLPFTTLTADTITLSFKS
jgi:hypothetical protein